MADHAHLSRSQLKVSPDRRTFALLSWLLVTLGLSSAISQTDLYGPDAPQDVAFVRFLNATGQDDVTPGVQGYEAAPLAHGEISEYQLLSPGEHGIEMAGSTISLAAEAESFHTVIALPDGILHLQDVPLRDISRGVLSLYNLDSEAILSLVTGEGTVVFEQIAPGTVSGIQIAEAEVTFEVHLDGEVVAVLEPRLYSRGRAHSIFVLPIGSDPQVVTASVGAEP